MKFGIFTIVPWHESKGQQQSLDEAIEQIELADRLSHPFSQVYALGLPVRFCSIAGKSMKF